MCAIFVFAVVDIVFGSLLDITHMYTYILTHTHTHTCAGGE